MTKTCATCRYSDELDPPMPDAIACNVGDVTPPTTEDRASTCPSWKIKHHLKPSVRFAKAVG